MGCPPFAPDDFLDLYVEGDRVHVALHQSFSRPPRFTESEAAALAAAARGAGRGGGGARRQALRDAVPEDRRAIFDELLERIYAGSPPARDSVLGRIAAGHRRAAGAAPPLLHRLPRRGERADRCTPTRWPSGFGHWYLWGHDPRRGKPLAFRLDRIRECALSDERFEPPADAELAPRAPLLRAERRPRSGFASAPLAAAWALARPGVRW